MSKLNQGQIRQGDVLLVASKAVEGTPEPAASDGSVVLAHGEVTGHRHRFERASEAQALTGALVRGLIVKSAAALLHEEHSAPTVAPGHYDLPRQTEWSDDNEPRQVAD